MAVWMDGGSVDSEGRNRSSAASTATRSSSKHLWRFIAAGAAEGRTMRHRSRFVLGFRFERFGCEFAVRFLQQDFYTALGLFQLLLAFARKLHPFFQQFHGLIQRELRAFEAAHNFFQARQRALKVRLLRSFWFL